MPDSSIDVMNRLLTVLYRSLPMYLNEASPWTEAKDVRAQAALDRLIADRQQDCRRVAAWIMDHYGAIELGEFPMEFTDLHFLSLDFLIKELIGYQVQDVAAIENCAARLARDPAALALAQEILGSERAHLELLEELVQQPAAT